MATTFFSSSLPGLSTALGVLRAGFVIVGNVPTTDGTSATVGTGALQLIDRHGHWLATWSDPQLLDGPWDLAVSDHGSWAHVFVANVLNGSVTRLTLSISGQKVTVQSRVRIAAGYTHRPDAAALVLGPTGLAYEAQSDTLFVASTADNAIFAIDNAGTRNSSSTRGRLVFDGSELRGPLALRFAPNGHLLAANGDAVNADIRHPSEIVEFTTHGRFVREYNVDSAQGGAFGLDTAAHGPFNYAVIDDVTNSLAVSKIRDSF
jgi:DNA-binding beta-propeller fold protein YncE